VETPLELVRDTSGLEVPPPPQGYLIDTGHTAGSIGQRIRSACRVAVLGEAGLGKSTHVAYVLNTMEARNAYGNRRFWADLARVRGGPADESWVYQAVGGRDRAEVAQILGQSHAVLVIDHIEVLWRRDTAATQRLLDWAVELGEMVAVVLVCQGHPEIFDHRFEILTPAPFSGEQAAEVFRRVSETDVADERIGPLLSRVGYLPRAVDLLARSARRGSVDELLTAARLSPAMTRGAGEGRDDNALRAVEIVMQVPSFGHDDRAVLDVLRVITDGADPADLHTLAPSLNTPRQTVARLKELGLAQAHHAGLGIVPIVAVYLDDHQPLPDEHREGIEERFIALAIRRASNPVDRQWLTRNGGNLARAFRHHWPHALDLAVAVYLTGDAQLLSPDAARLLLSSETADWAAELLTVEPDTHAPWAEYQRQAVVRIGLLQAVGDRLGEANTLRGLGQTAWARSHYDQADRYYQQALTTFQAVGDRLGEANTLRGLGETARIRSHYDQADRYYQQALTTYQTIGDRQGEANALSGLAASASDQNHSEQALSFSIEARTIYNQLGLRAPWLDAITINLRADTNEHPTTDTHQPTHE